MDKIFEQVLLENNKAIAERDARIKELEKELYTLRSWEEDASRENGDYDNECSACHGTFRGHKRRVTCKLCATPALEVKIKELEAELARVKEGVEKLPVIPVKRTASFESVDVVSTIDVILKSDLDKLMKGGE